MTSDGSRESIEEKTDLKTAPLCFIDIETTGSIFGYHEILDIAIVKTSANAEHILTEWHRRVRPMYPERITPEAAKINGYDQKLWEDVPAPSVGLWNEFNELTGGCVPVCHNPSFERAFISISAREFGVTKLELDYHWIGTESLAWPLYVWSLVPRLSLREVLKYFALPAEPLPHSAVRGARACLDVYRKLMSFLRGSKV